MKKSLFLALFASFIVAACSDDSSKSTDAPKTCDESLKPATAISCKCVDGAWAMCVYPAGDKCAASNCSPGTVCDSNTGNCVPSGNACKCDDGTDCPEGDKDKCDAVTCTCDDGSACPEGDKDKCGAETCTCDDGSECPEGDKAKCGAVTCTCDDGSECPEGDKDKCGAAACTCDDGSACPEGDKDKCGAETCTCDDGSECPEGDKDKCTAETCKCDDGSECPEGDKDKCTAETCKCDDGSACPEGDKDKCTAETCKCDDGSACPEGDKDKCGAAACTCDDGSECPEGDKDKCGSAEIDCDDALKNPDATDCSCNKTTGKWENCKCPKAPDNTIADSCKCDDKTGNWLEGTCKYNCDDNNRPYSNNIMAKSCECDNETGSWKVDTCTYDCPPEPENAVENSCQCDPKTATYKEGTCKINCVNPKPDKAVQSSCSCNNLDGEWDCTEWMECSNTDKPTENVESCTCSEGKWKCTYKCTKAKPNGYVEGTCICQADGEWHCDIDLCQNIPKLEGRNCNSNTGELTYNPLPQLSVSVDNSSISENGGVATITVKLTAEPSSDVSLSITPASDARITLTEPNNKKIPKSKWKTGVTYKVTGKNNSIVDGNKDISFTIKSSASGSDSDFNNLTGTQKITVVDDDKPSIIVSCDKYEIWPSVVKDHRYNDINDTEKITCQFSLGAKPDSNVNVNVTSECTQHDTGTRVTTLHNMANAEDDFTSATLTFTPSNYDKPQKISFDLKLFDWMPESNRPETHIIKATSSAPYYAVAKSEPIKAHVMKRYIVYPYTGTGKKTTLPKGKYRLHAIGASGGPKDAAYMQPDCPKSSGYIHFKYMNHGGLGAYIHGDLELSTADTIYVAVGGAGIESGSDGHRSFNGGGKGRAGGKDRRGVGGGGATDFCIGSDNCGSYNKHWPYRILVAGGGGGATALGWLDSNGEYNHGTGGQAQWHNDTFTDHLHKQLNGLRYGGAYYKYNDGSGTKIYLNAPGGGGLGAFDFICNFTGPLAQFYEPYFGKGANAGDCDDSPLASEPTYRNGGGGGGWYGGKFSICRKDVGGGAGSSYAFKGDNQGCHGKQNPKYKLQNVGGSIQYDCQVFHSKTISGVDYWGWETSTNDVFGLGDGIAWIETIE